MASIPLPLQAGRRTAGENGHLGPACSPDPSVLKSDHSLGPVIFTSKVSQHLLLLPLSLSVRLVSSIMWSGGLQWVPRRWRVKSGDLSLADTMGCLHPASVPLPLHPVLHA